MEAGHDCQEHVIRWPSFHAILQIGHPLSRGGAQKNAIGSYRNEKEPTLGNSNEYDGTVTLSTRVYVCHPSVFVDSLCFLSWMYALPRLRVRWTLYGRCNCSCRL